LKYRREYPAQVQPTLIIARYFKPGLRIKGNLAIYSVLRSYLNLMVVIYP
jgi:hypothetical protein